VRRLSSDRGLERSSALPETGDLRYRGVESEVPLPKIGGGGDQSAGKGSFRYEERSDEQFDDVMT
jgi:hypothetical protein